MQCFFLQGRYDVTIYMAVHIFMGIDILSKQTLIIAKPKVIRNNMSNVSKNTIINSIYLKRYLLCMSL